MVVKNKNLLKNLEKRQLTGKKTPLFISLERVQHLYGTYTKLERIVYKRILIYPESYWVYNGCVIV